MAFKNRDDIIYANSSTLWSHRLKSLINYQSWSWKKQLQEHVYRVCNGDLVLFAQNYPYIYNVHKPYLLRIMFFFISNSEHLNTDYMIVIFTLVQLLHFRHTWQYFLALFSIEMKQKQITYKNHARNNHTKSEFYSRFVSSGIFAAANEESTMSTAEIAMRLHCIAWHGVASNHHYLDIIQLGIHGMSKTNSSLLQTLFVHFDILANWNECV